MNFSEWNKFSNEDKQDIKEEIWEEIEKGKMPLESYIWMHPEADLSAADREAMAGWFAELYEEMKAGDGQLGMSSTKR